MWLPFILALLLKPSCQFSLKDMEPLEPLSPIAPMEDDIDECESTHPYQEIDTRPPLTPSSFPKWIGVPVRSLHQAMFEKVFHAILQKGLFFNEGRDELNPPPMKFLTPEHLRSAFNFTLNSGYGESEQDLLRHIYGMFEYSPKISHPMYLSQTGNGMDPYALAADWIAASVNSPPITYYLAPVYTVLEIAFVKKLLRLIGYPDGDGVVTPGPEYANIMALNAALQNKFPEYKLKGLTGAQISKVAIFIPATAVKYYEKVQMYAGLPKTSLVRIPVSPETERMHVGKLEEAIEKAIHDGVVPLFVVAMVGTDTLGAVDNIEEIANVTNKHGIWLHVDEHLGGGILISEQQRWRSKGIERSDSVSWSARRILATPTPTSFLLLRQSEGLKQAFHQGASYVFFDTELYNTTYDVGDKTLQTARRPEILKIWFTWKSKGRKGLERHINRQYENAKYLIKQLKRLEKARVLQTNPDTPLVSFYVIPNYLDDSEKDSATYNFRLNHFNHLLREHLVTSGTLYVSSSSHPDHSKQFHVLTAGLFNSAITKADIENVVRQIVYHARNLEQGHKEKFIPQTYHRQAPTNYTHDVSAAIKSLHKDFLVEVMRLILNKALFFQKKRCQSPMHFTTPEELETLLRMDLGDNALDHKSLIEELAKVIKYTPHFAHPMFILQLMSGLDAYAIMGDYIASTLNSPMVSYEDSPIPFLMELEVFKGTCGLIGYPVGECDGVIGDGGSMLNMLAIALARYRKQPGVKSAGHVDQKMVFFVSEDAHYSFQKGCASQGQGFLNCIIIKTDKRGRMMVSELRAAIVNSIEEGKIPIGVGATAGTTILGSIDPLNEIADICDEFDLHFHVDGVYGGALSWSEQHKYRLKGVDRSDTFGINFHKMFNSPHTGSILVSKHAHIFRKAFGSHAMPHGKLRMDRLYNRDIYDAMGDNQFMQARRANVVKIWFTWKARGTLGLGDHIDYLFDRAAYMLQRLKESPSFETLLPEFDLVNVCFYYIPPRLQGHRRNDSFWKEIDLVSKKLFVILPKKGVLNIIAQSFGRGGPFFLKTPILSSGVTDADLDYMITIIEHYGKDM